MFSTLLLNSDALPVSLLPLSVLHWEDAIKRYWLEDVEVLHYYEDWCVHSPSVTMSVPSVLILKQQIKLKKNLRLTNGLPTSSLVFLRDGYQCQYCDKVFPRNNLSMDHVIPKKYGGKTRWDNISTACFACNGQRGHDIRIQPKNKPFRPTYEYLVKMMKKFPLIIPHISWNYYLGWDAEKLILRSPKENRGIDYSGIEI